MTTLVILAALAAVSIAFNGYLLFSLKTTKKSDKQSRASQAIFRDLAAYGQGLLRVERIDPGDVFVRSPRDAR